MSLLTILPPGMGFLLRTCWMLRHKCRDTPPGVSVFVVRFCGHPGTGVPTASSSKTCWTLRHKCRDTPPGVSVLMECGFTDTRGRVSLRHLHRKHAGRCGINVGTPLPGCPFSWCGFADTRGRVSLRHFHRKYAGRGGINVGTPLPGCPF